MGRTVTMQFSDGTVHDIDVTADDAEAAVVEARDWVQDGAWFEVWDDEGKRLEAEARFRR